MSRTPDNAVVVGLTGGIATGKSTTSKLLAKHAAADDQVEALVLDADQFGHLAYAKGTKCLQQ